MPTELAIQVTQERLVVVRASGSARWRGGGGLGSTRIPAIDRPEHAVQDGGDEQQVDDEADHVSSVASRANILFLVKNFVIYTGLRISLFILCWVVIGVTFRAVFGDGDTVWIWALIAAAVVSSLISLRYLAGYREGLAQSVQARAERASEKFEEMKTKEDTD